MIKITKSKISRQIVIDTSVLHEAGLRSNSPSSVICRNILDDILAICHKIIFSDLAQKEWDNHKKAYTSKWLNQMRKKGKYKKLELSKEFNFQKNDQQFSDLLRTIDNNPDLTPKQKDAAKKDAFIIFNALKADHIVISIDKPAQKHFSLLSKKYKTIEQIHWINPSLLDSNDLRKWLEDGTPPNNEWMLKTYARQS